MKKILFLHGFTSGGKCEIADGLRRGLNGVAKVVAPDIALHPCKAMAQLQGLCDNGHFDLIVGSSCGAFYGQQLVRLTGLPAVLVNPFFKMTEFLRPRLGRHEYKCERADGRQFFEVTPELVAEFEKMEAEQFDCYDEFNRTRVLGLFGTEDTLANFRALFSHYYDRMEVFDGSHTMTANNVRHALVPAVKRMLDEYPHRGERYFRHFKGNRYRLVRAAKDSETMERMVVYQALYGECGYWVRPERMFFERITRDGRTFPRFAETAEE